MPPLGRWRTTPSFPADADRLPLAVTTFAWLTGQRFPVQHLEIDHPGASVGSAVLGADPNTGPFVQHYFDSRGLIHRHAMDFAGGPWTLERLVERPDVSHRFA